MRDLHVNGFSSINPPTNCAHCGLPFPVKDGEFTAWRGSNRQFNCYDFCEDGDAEKIYLEERRALPVGTRSFAPLCDDADAPSGTWHHRPRAAPLSFPIAPEGVSIGKSVPPTAEHIKSLTIAPYYLKPNQWHGAVWCVRSKRTRRERARQTAAARRSRRA